MPREILPNRRQVRRLTFKVGSLVYTGTLGYYDDGRLGEVFLHCGLSGTDANTVARDSAFAVSFALQHGCTAETIRSAFTRDATGSPEGPLGILFDMLVQESTAE